jgi:ribonuclease Z
MALVRDQRERRLLSIKHEILSSLFIILIAGALGCGPVQKAMMQRNIDRVAEGNRPGWLADDAMHVVLCGTGSPLLDPERAGPCTAVIAGGKMYLVDVGPSSIERSLEYRLPLAQLDGILLTHFHSDHIGELGEAMTQSWIAGGRAMALDVYGPSGVVGVVDGFLQAYALDQVYRTAHHTQQYMPKEGAGMKPHTISPTLGEDVVVLEDGGLKVIAIEVDHAPVVPAVAYRFEYAGRSVVISGDTDYSANLGRGAKGADLLIHEVLEKKIMGTMSQALADNELARMSRLASDVLDYHTSPQDAVRLARESEVSMLVFSHLVPPVSGFMARRIFLGDLGDKGDVDVLLGEDGMHFRLDPDGGIERDSLD